MSKMTVTGKITWCLMFVAVFVLSCGELIAEDAAQPDLAQTQVQLQQLLKDELFLDTVVEVDDEHVLIIYTPQVESEEELLPELTMAVYAAGIAAPWAQEIGVIIQTTGLPLGHVIVPTQAVKNWDEGRINLDAFYLQWVMMPYTAPDATASDMLLQDWELPAGWTIQGQQEDTPEAVLAKVGVTITEEIPIEEWLAAWSELDTPDGSLIVAALLTVSDLDVTEVLESLGATLDPDNPTVHPTLTLTGPPAVLVSGRANVLFAIAGPTTPAQQALDLLKQLTLAENPLDGLVAESPAPPPAEGTVTPPAAGTTAQPTTGETGAPLPPAIFPGETQPPAVSLSPDSVVKQAILCKRVDEHNTPQGVTETFPAGTEKVGLYLEVQGAPANTEITLEWSRGGRLLRRQLLLASGNKKLLSYIYAAGQQSLKAGNYTVEIKENDQLVARLLFTIE